MKDNKPNKELTDQLKKGLKLAQMKEELDALVSSAGMELNDDELDAAAGGQISFPGDIPNPACDEGPGPY